MNYIYGSKLFRSSSRKEHIKANMSNPINTELVTQLSNMIDSVDDDTNMIEPAVDDTLENSDSTSDDTRTIADEDIDQTSFAGEGESSTKLDSADPSEVIEPQSDIADSRESTISDTSDDATELETVLNTNLNTQGVLRCTEKDDELWVYYNDDINISKILPDIMDEIDNSSITDLSFSRIARSNNAIVFDRK